MNVGRIIAKIPLKGFSQLPLNYMAFVKEVTAFFFSKGRQITILPCFPETALEGTLRIVFEIPDGPPKFVTLKFGHFLAERLSALKITRLDLYPWAKAKDIMAIIKLVLNPSAKKRIQNRSGIKIYYGDKKFEAKQLIENLQIEEPPIQPPPQPSEITEAPSIHREDSPSKLTVPLYLENNRFYGKTLSEVFQACRRCLPSDSKEQKPDPEEFTDLEVWLEFALRGNNWDRVLGYLPDEKAEFVLIFRKLRA